MALSKYPVISRSGKEYRVDVFKGTFGYVTEVFEERKVRTLFGREKIKFKSVHGGSELACCYAGDEWDYDFIRMAKHSVRNYEKNIEREEEKLIKINNQINNFEKWDGKCT